MNTTFFHTHQELFRKAKAQLGHVHNEHATNNSKLSHDIERQAELCSMAIDTILHHTEDYDAVGYVPPQVQEHTVQMLESIPHPDAIFGLLEDLALITRGHTLFAHTTHSSEKVLLQAFENSGEWEKGDGSIVSDWYWLRLPALACMPRTELGFTSSQSNKHHIASMQEYGAETEALHHILLQYPDVP